MCNRRERGVVDIVWDDGGAQPVPHAALRAACKKCRQCQTARLLDPVRRKLGDCAEQIQSTPTPA
ncbi:DUF971 domain-containing protein, partial [Massilia sp. CCM 8734]|nr:DUF971 domain-containing protein [Massilia sp. CCM 8734]